MSMSWSWHRRLRVSVIVCAVVTAGATFALSTPASAAPWTRVGSIGAGDGDLATGVAQASNGDFWVSEQEHFRRLGADGTAKGSFGSQGVGPGQFNLTGGIAVGPDGTVYVVDVGGHRVERFTDSGTFIQQFGSAGSGPGQLNEAEGIAISSDGTVYVADYANGNVDKWTSDGVFLGTLGSSHQFGSPFGVGIDPQGNIWIADAIGGAVYKASPAGTPLLSIFSGGAPFAVTFTAASAVVSDISGGHPALRTYGLDGTLLDTLALDNQVSHGRVAVGSDGRLYATESYWGLAVYDPPGQSEQQVSSVTVAPSAGSDIVGTSHTVTVTARDATAGPVGRTVVYIQVSGANPAGGACATTTTAGTCTFTYLGSGMPGDDAISACAYLDGRFEQAPAGPCGSATEHWIAVGDPAAITSVTATSVGMRSPFDFQVSTTGTPTPTLSETGSLPSGVSFIDNGDGTADISGVAALGTAGTYPITIEAVNGVGDPAEQHFVLTVTSASSPPVIVSPSADAETFGVPFSFTVSTTGYPVPTLKKTGNLPAGVTYTDNGNGTATIAGTAANAAIGVYPLTLTAKSSAGTYTQALSLTITKAPSIKKIPTTTAHVGTNVSVSITAKGYTPPTLTASGLPAGLVLTDGGGGNATIDGAPLAGTGGTYSVVVVATNTLGSASQTFTLKVNETPAITSPTTATATASAAFSFQVTATGFPDPKLAKVGTLPRGIAFNAATGTFSGTPKANTVGAYPITITAKNSTGTFTQAFTLIVQ